jgi:hypothetical protein
MHIGRHAELLLLRSRSYLNRMVYSDSIYSNFIIFIIGLLGEKYGIRENIIEILIKIKNEMYYEQSNS